MDFERLQKTKNPFFIPRLPGSLDPTWGGADERHKYSEDAMDDHGEFISHGVEQMRTPEGFDLGAVPKEDLGHMRQAAETFGWWMAGGCTPEELERLMDGDKRPRTPAEHVARFLQTEWGARFLTLDPAERRRMVTDIGTDFD